MITVVTGFSPEGYELYGKKMIKTFHQYWPDSVNLMVYCEDPIEMPRGGTVSRWRPVGINEFLARNSAIKERCGKSPRRGWERKHHKSGYNYRFDACRFCWQLFYPEDASESLRDGDIMVWLDGDVHTTSEVSLSFIQAALDEADIVHLGRETQSELGFWAVRLNPGTRLFLRSMADMYRTDKVFQLDQWHSGFVFDHCLAQSGCRVKNLTPGGTGNVWLRTPLASFSVHLKGRLKTAQEHAEA